MPTNMSPKNLSRAESRIFISFRPSESINNEISITGGYKYKKKSQVRVNVGNSNFKLEIKDNFAWLINYDDEIRMIKAMKNGKVFALGLDVYRGEPIINKKYLELDNLFLLPHLGSATSSTRIAMGDRAIDNLDSFLNKKISPKDCVN